MESTDRFRPGRCRGKGGVKAPHRFRPGTGIPIASRRSIP